MNINRRFDSGDSENGILYYYYLCLEEYIPKGSFRELRFRFIVDGHPSVSDLYQSAEDVSLDGKKYNLIRFGDMSEYTSHFREAVEGKLPKRRKRRSESGSSNSTQGGSQLKKHKKIDQRDHSGDNEEIEYRSEEKKFEDVDLLADLPIQMERDNLLTKTLHEKSKTNSIQNQIFSCSFSFYHLFSSIQSNKYSKSKRPLPPCFAVSHVTKLSGVKDKYLSKVTTVKFYPAKF